MSEKEQNKNVELDAEFKEVEATEDKEVESVNKGVLLFHTDSGTVGYQVIGDVTLENMVYYNSYLNRITDETWKATEMNTGNKGE